MAGTPQAAAAFAWLEASGPRAGDRSVGLKGAARSLAVGLPAALPGFLGCGSDVPAGGATVGRPAHLAVNGPQLIQQAAVEGYTTAFGWAAAIFAVGALITGSLLRSGVRPEMASSPAEPVAA